MQCDHTPLVFKKIKMHNYAKSHLLNMFGSYYHHLLFFFSLQSMKSSNFINCAWKLIVEAK